MYIVDSLGMCGNIRKRGINLSNFQCQLQLRCLIYEEMINSSTYIVFFGFFVGANLKNVIIFLYTTYNSNAIIVCIISDTYCTV